MSRTRSAVATWWSAQAPEDNRLLFESMMSARTRFGDAYAAAMRDKALDAYEVSTRLRTPDWYEVRIASRFNQPARKRE